MKLLRTCSSILLSTVKVRVDYYRSVGVRLSLSLLKSGPPSTECAKLGVSGKAVVEIELVSVIFSVPALELGFDKKVIFLGFSFLRFKIKWETRI